MNFSAFIGFAAAAGVVLFAVNESQGTSTIILNTHALVIVLGGTFAATVVSFPILKVFKLCLLAMKRLLGLRPVNFEKLIQEVISIAETSNKDLAAFRERANTVSDPFLKEGLILLADGATEEQLLDIMGTRLETFVRRHTAEVNMFRTISKFPPAFGLLGTTFGMIALLSQLSKPDAQSLIGPAMAIGLVATLYGIATTNFIFIPIAESLSVLNGEDYSARRIVIDALVLIKRKVHPIIVEEKMKSFLLPSERSRVSRQPRR